MSLYFIVHCGDIRHQKLNIFTNRELLNFSFYRPQRTQRLILRTLMAFAVFRNNCLTWKRSKKVKNKGNYFKHCLKYLRSIVTFQFENGLDRSTRHFWCFSSGKMSYILEYIKNNGAFVPCTFGSTVQQSMRQQANIYTANSYRHWNRVHNG